MLLEAIEQLFPDHDFKWDRRGSSFAKGLCPLHKNDHTPAFAIYVDAKGREKWHCFTEDIGGNLLDLVRRSGIPGTESIAGANHWMTQKGYLDETEKQKEERERNEALFKFYKWTNELLCTSRQAAGIRSYIASRHIDTETLNEAALGYYPSLREVKEWVIAEGLESVLNSEVLTNEVNAAKYVDGSLIFFYKSSYAEISRLKVRNPSAEKDKEKKTCFLGSRTSKKEKLGYFSWWMDAMIPSSAILVEGEFDVGALTTLTIKDEPGRREPIYCFSGGGNISNNIELIHNMGIENVYIFPDNDEPGMGYAENIAENFPDTYSIVPKDYKEGSDPAEWAADHTYEDLKKAFSERMPAFIWIGQGLAERYVNATIEEQASIKTKIIDYGKRLSPTNRESFIKAFGILAGVSLESVLQEIEESSLNIFRKALKPESFGIWMNKSTGKNPDWKQISNVILEHVEDVVMDDYGGDEGIARTVTIKATTVNQSKLVTMKTEEFTDDKKLRLNLTTALGTAAVLIEPRMESQLRNSMVVLDIKNQNPDAKATESLIYLHTGWRDGRYYMPNGYVDGEGFHEPDDIEVQLPDTPRYFKNYYLGEPSADFEYVKKLLREEILQVFSYDITLPFLAHVFWTVISEFIPMAKPYVLWVVGQTGSFKTSYTGVMASFFGDFKTADFETWRSTVNAIEQNGYYLKDAPFVIDDYKPVDIKREEVTRCIQNYADRHGRARMKRGQSVKQDRTYWIRGNVIVTAEDVPPEGETSIAARTLELRVPNTGDPKHLTNAQINANLLPGVMAKFIQFLCNKHINSADYERILAERRDRFHMAAHARVKENLAANSIAWDFVSEFFGFEDLNAAYAMGIQKIMMNMNLATKSQSASEVFIEGIRSLLATGSYYFEGLGISDGTPHIENAKRLGWMDEQGVYIIGQESLAEVNKLRIQLTGMPLNYTMRSIYDQLNASHYIVIDPKTGEVTKPKRIGGFQFRVIQFKRGILEEAVDETPRDKFKSETAIIRDPRSDPGSLDGKQ